MISLLKFLKKTEITAKSVSEATQEALLELGLCEDDTFVNDVVDAVYYNDSKALQYMENELE